MYDVVCNNCNKDFSYNDDDFRIGYYIRHKRGINHYLYIECPRCGKKVVTFSCSEKKYREIKGKEKNKSLPDELIEYKLIGTLEECKKYKEFYEYFNKDKNVSNEINEIKKITLNAEDCPLSSFDGSITFCDIGE